MSKHHAVITWDFELQQFLYENLSKNGSVVDNKEIKAGDGPVQLDDGVSRSVLNELGAERDQDRRPQDLLPEADRREIRTRLRFVISRFGIFLSSRSLSSVGRALC